jgi:hypothetical protein
MKKYLYIASLLGMLVLWLGTQADAVSVVGGYRIETVYPTVIGNKGKVSLNIVGDLIDENGIPVCNPKLWGPQCIGSYNVSGTVVKIEEDVYPNPNTDYGPMPPYDVMTVTFDFSDYPDGIMPGLGGGYVQLFDCNDPSVMISGNVDVAENDYQGLWVEITGRTQVRLNTTTEYIVHCGNSGNTDISSAVLYLAIPKSLDYELLFDPAPYQNFWPEGLNETDELNGSLTPDFEADFDTKPYVVIPLRLENIGPGMLTPFRIKVTWGSNAEDHLIKAFWHGSKSTSYHPIQGSISTP